MRQFTKIPKNYVKSNYEIPTMGDENYPSCIIYDPGYDTHKIFKYKQKYLHEPDNSNEGKMGVYYIVNEMSTDGGQTFEPIPREDYEYLQFLNELDLCEDNEVGFTWNGHFNHLGYLDGNAVVRG